MRKTLIFGVAILLVSLFMACANSVAATNDPTDDVVGVQRYVYVFGYEESDLVDGRYTMVIPEITLDDMPMIQIYQKTTEGAYVSFPGGLDTDGGFAEPCYVVKEQELVVKAYTYCTGFGCGSTEEVVKEFKVVIIK